MAQRNFANSRIYTGHVMPVLLDVSIPIGASGAVGTIAGPYIKAVTKLATGTYQIQMSDNYSGYYLGEAQMISPAIGSDLSIRAADTALTIGKSYVITILGGATAADWAALGVPTGVTAAVGVAFVALATGAGTDAVAKVKLVGDSGIAKVELVGNPNNTIAPMGAATTGALGAIALVQCMGPVLTMNSYTPAGTNDGGTPPIFTGTPAVLTGTVTYAAANPVNGSVLKLSFLLSNSSILIGGE